MTCFDLCHNLNLRGPPLQTLPLSGGCLLRGARLRDFRRLLGARVPLIGVGGIATPQQAYARIRAGASLVQLYSALVYEGPRLVGRIKRGLLDALAREKTPLAALAGRRAAEIARG